MISSEKSSNSNKILSADKIYSDDTIILQSKNGYRFNSDSMILSWFIHKSLQGITIKNSLEIGAGTGVVSIVLRKRGFKSSIDCVEVQQNMFTLLSKNIAANNLTGNLFPFNEDFRVFSEVEKKQYDLIFTNPPFFGISSGKVNDDGEKAKARHEFFGTLNNFFASSLKILRKNGHFIFVFPLSRIQFALSSASTNNLVLKNICFFRENTKVFPSSFAAHLIYKNSENSSKSDLITIRDQNGEYSETGKEIMYYKN